MLSYLKEEANKTYTENGAITHMTTLSDNLDLFATIGALRHVDETEIIRRFKKAYIENPDLAMKTLFFSRDVRGGLGERRTFRVCMNWLAEYKPDSVIKNIDKFAEFGRFDDLLCLMDTSCKKQLAAYIEKCLRNDLQAMEEGQGVSLLAKWLPSVNASSKETVLAGKKMAKALGMQEAAYRKTLSRLRRYTKILENHLREMDYTFAYEKQPSKALFRYRAAFMRNDRERYETFLGKVSSGESKLHAGTVMPYEIIRPLTTGWAEASLSEADRLALDVSWNALEDFCDKTNALAVIDGSGSMYCNGNPQPFSVALSLGLYFAERNKGAFKNHFITFSRNPRLVEIKGKDIVDKINYCKEFNEIADTNIQKVFELVLHTAVKYHVPQEELPETLYIITDMEFNCCTVGADLTNFQYAKELFEAHGYKLPQIVFWNVASRNVHQPVKMNEKGVILISGCTPRIFSMAAGGHLDPYEFMMEVLGSQRYADIAA